MITGIAIVWWSSRLGMKGGADAPQTEPRRRRRAEEPAPRFVPVVVRGRSTIALAKAPIVIRHGATTLEVEGCTEVSPAWVAAVMIELERAACS